MPMTNFVGKRKPLDAFDIPRLAHRLKVSEDHLRAFLEVEARSRGFDRLGRPVMLFEPHVFHRNLPESKRVQAEQAGLAYPKWGQAPYPSDSYPRLIQAIAIDETAALKACSIGLSQVLVENYSSVGFSTPQEMWAAFMDDEEEHVEAMVRFILVNGIDDDLRAQRWATVARVYNGPGYARHGYDKKLAAAYAKFRAQADVNWAPDKPDPARLTVTDSSTIKSVQKRLHELGYPEAGRADGQWGTKTRAAVLGFRADKGLPLVADVDEDLLAALMVADKRPVSEARAATTTADLRKAGSRQVEAADTSQSVGVMMMGGGGLAGVTELLGGVQGQLGALDGLASQIAPLVDTVKSVSPYLLLGLGAYLIYQQVIVKRARVQDTREGKHVGR